MLTRVLAFLAVATIANANDVIVGLKTDGKKIFDENRQANPALWRQMDNVTIKAPENEVIRRVVITDLRPDKDGDVKVVEGGEGQKNVTIELKSPTVLRGYDFHIEVYSVPEENVPFTNDQQSTTAIVQDGPTAATSNNPTSDLDTTSKLPELSPDKIVPAIIFNDEMKESEREGRNLKTEENNTSDPTTESSSTTIKNDVSTTQQTENATENRSEKSDTPKNFNHESTMSPIPLNKNFNPAVPAMSGKDIANDNTETRHVRDTEKEKELDLSFDMNLHSEDLAVETVEEVGTTETGDVIKYVEEKLDEEEVEVESEVSSIESEIVKRGTNEEQMIDSTTGPTTTLDDSSTTEINAETTTISIEDCIPTEPTIVQNPVVDNSEVKPDPIPVYVNNRQWEQRFNNPMLGRDGQNDPGLKFNPADLTRPIDYNLGL